MMKTFFKRLALAFILIIAALLTAVYFYRVNLTNFALEKLLPENLNIRIDHLNLGFKNYGLGGLALNLDDGSELQLGLVRLSIANLSAEETILDGLKIVNIEYENADKTQKLIVPILELKDIRITQDKASVKAIELHNAIIEEKNTAATIKLRDIFLDGLHVAFPIDQALSLSLNKVTLKDSKVSLVDAELGEIEISLDTAVTTSIKAAINDPIAVKIGELTLEKIRLLSKNIKSEAKLQSLNLKLITFDSDINIESLSAGEFTYLPIIEKNETPPSWALSLKALNVNAIDVGEKSGSIDTIQLSNGAVNLAMMEDGKVDIVPVFLQKSDKQEGVEKDTALIEGAENEGSKKENEAYDFKIGELNLAEGFVIDFHDGVFGVKHHLNIQELSIKDIINSPANTHADLKMLVNVEERGEIKLTLNYDETPLTIANAKSKDVGNIKIVLDARYIELFNYSKYFEKTAGYSVSSGQADLKLNLDVTGEMFEGVAEIAVRKIYLETVDEALSESLAKQISMPLPTALNILKDKKGNIKLKIPIQGDMENQNFGLGSVATLLGKKVVNFVSRKYILATVIPAGLMLDAASIFAGSVYDKVTALSPVVFKKGESQLDRKARKILDGIAELMTEKEELTVMLCPVVMLDEFEDESLRLRLAKSRVQSVKDFLIEANISNKRLQLCKPVLDDKKYSLVYIRMK